MHRGSECAIVVLYKPVPNGYRYEVIMRRFLSFLLVFLGAIALGAGTAHAEGDNSISTSSPAAGEVIALAPTQIQLRFSLPVGGADAVAQMGLVLTCESRIINLGSPQLGADGVTVSAALTQILENGDCRVEWSLPDGSSGSFTFVSNAQTTTTAPAEPGTTNTTVPAVPGQEGETEELRLGGPLGLMKWLAFFFVSALVGGLIFIKIAWPEGVESPSATSASSPLPQLSRWQDNSLCTAPNNLAELLAVPFLPLHGDLLERQMRGAHYFFDLSQCAD